MKTMVRIGFELCRLEGVSKCNFLATLLGLYRRGLQSGSGLAGSLRDLSRKASVRKMVVDRDIALTFDDNEREDLVLARKELESAQDNIVQKNQKDSNPVNKPTQ